MNYLTGIMNGKEHYAGFFGKDTIKDEQALEILLKDYFGNKRVDAIKKSVLSILDENQEESSFLIQAPPSKKMKQVCYQGKQMIMKDYSTTEYTNPLLDFLHKQPELTITDTAAEEVLDRIVELISVKKFDIAKLSEEKNKDEINPSWIPKGFKYTGGDLESGYIISDEEGNEYIYCPQLDKYVSRFYISKFNSSKYGISKPNTNPWCYVSYSDVVEMLNRASKNLPYNCELFSIEEHDVWRQWCQDGINVEYSSTQDSKQEMISKITGIVQTRNFEFNEKDEKLLCWTTSKEGDQHFAINQKGEKSHYLAKYSGENTCFRVLLSKKD